MVCEICSEIEISQRSDHQTIPCCLRCPDPRFESVNTHKHRVAQGQKRTEGIVRGGGRLGKILNPSQEVMHGRVNIADIINAVTKINSRDIKVS